MIPLDSASYFGSLAQLQRAGQQLQSEIPWLGRKMAATSPVYTHHTRLITKVVFVF
jgi:hypothetical protein